MTDDKEKMALIRCDEGIIICIGSDVDFESLGYRVIPTSFCNIVINKEQSNDSR